MMEKDKIIIEKNDQEYVAYSPELGKGSCYGQGKTEIEALNNFLKEKKEFLKLLSQLKLKIGGHNG